jgi:hypothetical protein
LPPLVALARQRPGSRFAFVANLLLGWTVVGWVADDGRIVKFPAQFLVGRAKLAAVLPLFNEDRSHQRLTEILTKLGVLDE